MDTNVALEVFINNGMMDKSLAKDVREEMSNSGKELWETLIDFGVIGAPEDFWSVIATEVGAQFISLEGFVPSDELLAMIPAPQARILVPCPSNTVRAKVCTSVWKTRSTPRRLTICVLPPIRTSTCM